MIRVRFHADLDDPRPIKWPPPGPFWITGSGDEYSTVVAYLNTEAEIEDFWPEATAVDVHELDCEPQFSDRFPQPEWWSPDA